MYSANSEILISRNKISGPLYKTLTTVYSSSCTEWHILDHLEVEAKVSKLEIEPILTKSKNFKLCSISFGSLSKQMVIKHQCQQTGQQGYSFYGMNRVNLVNVFFFCTGTAFVWFDSDDLHLSILQILLIQYRPLLDLLQ